MSVIINKSTLAKEVNGQKEFIYPKTSADMVDYSEDKTVAQKIDEIVSNQSSSLSSHNTSEDSHNDIRLLISDIVTRLNSIADSDDVDLDQFSELIALIKSNKSLIDSITISKVNVSDIIDNYTTNVSNKPVSAAVAVRLKALIDAITVPTKTSQLTNDSGFITTDTFSETGLITQAVLDARIKELLKLEYIDNVLKLLYNSEEISSTTMKADIFTVCAVSNKLTNVTNSNSAEYVELGSSYEATLTPSSGSITSITVYMNGSDVTGTVYNDGVISISKVTGNLEIIAIA